MLHIHTGRGTELRIALPIMDIPSHLGCIVFLAYRLKSQLVLILIWLEFLSHDLLLLIILRAKVHPFYIKKKDCW
ncbi:hypothetical protein LINGRAHAP2_LOCUS12713 [Linum grandiflorum]